MEIFIKDSEKGIVPTGFDDVKDGSLFAVYKVNSPELWEMCKQGIFNSFSLEGYFNTVEVKANKQEEKNITIMSKIKELLTKVLAEFASVTAEDGTELIFDGEELAVGMEVADAEGNAIADGEYVVESNVVVVKDGKVEEIKEKEEEVTEEPAEEEEIEAEVEEEPVAEEPTEPEYDAKGEIDRLQAEIDALKSEIETIKAQLAEPASEPIAEEFEKVVEQPKDKKLARLQAIGEALKG